MEVSASAWANYVNKLSALDATATKKVGEFIGNFKGFSFNNPDHMKALIDYAYGISTAYGEGAAALACEMYDAVGLASGVFLEPAIPAEVASYGDVAKAINGTAKYKNVEMVSSSVGRLVKRTGADTTLKNALRDGAEFAWIPSGDTCAFCIALASRGWQKASKKAIKGGHAEHIHSNCDCTYMIRHSEDFNVAGYDPQKYADMYYGAEGDTPKEKINAMRRKFYAENKSIVGAESDKAEELIRSISDYEKSIINNPTESAKLYKKDGSVVDFGGVEHSVIGDASVLNEMEGGILTHNHPTDVTFSNNDIANGIVKGNLAELRAITIKGNLHQLINENASIDDRRKFFVQFNERIKKYTNIAHDKIRRGERINQQEYVNSRLEQWLLENAPQYHLRYIKAKV